MHCSNRVSDGRFQGRIEHCFGRRWIRREGICRCIVSELAVEPVEHRFCFRPKLLSSIRRDDVRPYVEGIRATNFSSVKIQIELRGREDLINNLVTRFANFTELKFHSCRIVSIMYLILFEFPVVYRARYLSPLAKRGLAVSSPNRLSVVLMGIALVYGDENKKIDEWTRRTRERTNRNCELRGARREYTRNDIAEIYYRGRSFVRRVERQYQVRHQQYRTREYFWDKSKLNTGGAGDRTTVRWFCARSK